MVILDKNDGGVNNYQTHISLFGSFVVWNETRQSSMREHISSMAGQCFRILARAPILPVLTRAILSEMLQSEKCCSYVNPLRT